MTSRGNSGGRSKTIKANEIRRRNTARKGTPENGRRPAEDAQRRALAAEPAKEVEFKPGAVAVRKSQQQQNERQQQNGDQKSSESGDQKSSESGGQKEGSSPSSKSGSPGKKDAPGGEQSGKQSLRAATAKRANRRPRPRATHPNRTRSKARRVAGRSRLPQPKAAKSSSVAEGERSQGGESGSPLSKNSSSDGQQSGKQSGKSGQGGEGKTGQGQPGSGEPKSGGGMQDSRGGGGGAGAASTKGDLKDDSKESPPAKEPDDPGKGLVPPETAEQNELTLRKLHDLMNDPETLQREGISRSDVEQFAKKFEKKQSPPPGPGREIKVKPGEQTPVKPSPNLPGLDRAAKFSTTTRRDQSGSVPQDDVQDNFEGLRLRPPAELVPKYQTSSPRSGRSSPQRTATKASPKSGQ